MCTHKHTHTHTLLLLGCSVASAQPHTAAKSESNILCSPHVARPWPRPQWKLHISVTLSVHLSLCPFVCSLSVCLHVCLTIYLPVWLSASLFVSLSVLAWLPGYESTRLSAMCPSPVYLSSSICLSGELSHCMHTLTVCLAVLCCLYLSACCAFFLPLSLSECSVIKRNICSGSSRQQH